MSKKKTNVGNASKALNSYTSKAKDKSEKAIDEMFIRNLENAINAATGHWENPVKELFNVKTRAYKLITGESFSGISDANLSMCKAIYGYTHNAWIGLTELKELEKKAGIKFDYPAKNKLVAMPIRQWWTWCYKAVYEVNFDGDFVEDENGNWVRAENRMDNMTKWHKNMTEEEVNENGYWVEKWEHKYTDIYNVEQIDWKGYDYTKYLRVPVVYNDIEIDTVRIEQVKAWMLANYKGGAPAIKLTAGNTNYYSISKDAVYMVAENKFISTGEYLSSLAHEIAHSTGAKGRLGRDFSGRFGSPSYAVEELVAETSSLMIMALSGTKDTIENSLRYLKGWLKKAKETSKLDMIFNMAKQAVGWILGEVEDIVPVGIFAENEKDESPEPVAESKAESVEPIATVDESKPENATPEPAPDNPAPVAKTVELPAMPLKVRMYFAGMEKTKNRLAAFIKLDKKDFSRLLYNNETMYITHEALREADPSKRNCKLTDPEPIADVLRGMEKEGGIKFADDLKAGYTIMIYQRINTVDNMETLELYKWKGSVLTIITKTRPRGTREWSNKTIEQFDTTKPAAKKSPSLSTAA